MYPRGPLPSIFRLEYLGVLLFETHVLIKSEGLELVSTFMYELFLLHDTNEIKETRGNQFPRIYLQLLSSTLFLYTVIGLYTLLVF